ncbi:MAG TPA: MBL fold metallo-hydrolase [Pyrinomonadaceae bacterium]|jgi:glyoxylase-like metal-dependent hydrolase (beta-lactamase superfamily II)/rhodanese-related sulfurtransferase|nr:MBL fold metallo-hydrolase [Pyrinomonadaceae bacterium]
MYFKQFYLGCLAHASYLIGADGEAAVVDPQRDVDQYIEEAAAQNLKIKYIIETHLHADFVSGHRELAARTGAEIVFGKKARANFPHRAVEDGDELAIGRVSLQILETPGHTPESICVLVTDAHNAEEPQKILTGDTLFIGDIGRPDLAGGKGYTPQMMAAMMYDTLHNKILKLDDAVEVYPAHGAGSMCGKNLSSETSSTIGQQRQFNYALQPMTKDEFVRMMTVDLPAAPAYFPKDAEINRAGASPLSELQPLKPMSPADVADSVRAGEVILDVRSAAEFGTAHVPGSLNIGLSGQFASWAGTLISMETPLVLVAGSKEQAEEARTRLARVGLEKVTGFLVGGIDAWKAAGFDVATVQQISVAELKELIASRPDLQVVDVRRAGEFESGHAPQAIPAPLSNLNETLPSLKLNPTKLTAVICAGGYRSSAATSIMQPQGFTNLLNVSGGTSAWVKAGYEVEKSVPLASASGS